MNNTDRQYLELCRHILENGAIKDDRTGTGTISVFGTRMEFDLNDGFPLLTTKKINLNNIIIELLWFISGNTNIRTLVLQGCNIWNRDAYRGYFNNCTDDYVLSYSEFVERIKKDKQFADVWADLGKTYGYMWRKKGGEKGLDPLKDVIRTIRHNPDSRRMLIASWDASTANELTLPPCHPFFQFYVENNKISCQFVMRSSDTFLGLPYNIASYALLTMMIAQECGLGLGKLIYIGGDTHIYLDHIEQVKLQMKRTPKKLPKIILNPDIKSTFDFTLSDIMLEGYDPHPAIKGEMST